MSQHSFTESPTVMECITSSQRSVGESSVMSTGASTPDDIEEWEDLYRERLACTEGTWVACTQCNKWRYCHSVVDAAELSRLETWTCHMCDDEAQNSCEKAQLEEYDRLELVPAEFFVGSLVWARVWSYPWWPAMIDDDPDTCQYMWLDDHGQVTHYHVVFLDDNVSRAWVPVDYLRHFEAEHTQPPVSGLRVKSKWRKSFEQAVNNAKRFGHLASGYRGQTRCRRCAGPHDLKKCVSSIIKCALCGGGHFASYWHCPKKLKFACVHRRALAVQVGAPIKRMAVEGTGRFQVMQPLEQRFVDNKISYADAVKQAASEVSLKERMKKWCFVARYSGKESRWEFGRHGGRLLAMTKKKLNKGRRRILVDSQTEQIIERIRANPSLQRKLANRASKSGKRAKSATTGAARVRLLKKALDQAINQRPGSQSFTATHKRREIKNPLEHRIKRKRDTLDSPKERRRLKKMKSEKENAFDGSRKRKSDDGEKNKDARKKKAKDTLSSGESSWTPSSPRSSFIAAWSGSGDGFAKFKEPKKPAFAAKKVKNISKASTGESSSFTVTPQECTESVNNESLTIEPPTVDNTDSTKEIPFTEDELPTSSQVPFNSTPVPCDTVSDQLNTVELSQESTLGEESSIAASTGQDKASTVEGGITASQERRAKLLDDVIDSVLASIVHSADNSVDASRDIETRAAVLNETSETGVAISSEQTSLATPIPSDTGLKIAKERKKSPGVAKPKTSANSQPKTPKASKNAATKPKTPKGKLGAANTKNDSLSNTQTKENTSKEIITEKPKVVPKFGVPRKVTKTSGDSSDLGSVAAISQSSGNTPLSQPSSTPGDSVQPISQPLSQASQNSTGRPVSPTVRTILKDLINPLANQDTNDNDEFFNSFTSQLDTSHTLDSSVDFETFQY